MDLNPGLVRRAARRTRRTDRSAEHADRGQSGSLSTRRPEQLRVVVLANSLEVGGAETQLVRLAVGLAGRGHEVVVATLLPRHRLRYLLDAAGVPVVDIPTAGPAGPGLALAAAVRLLRQRRPDAVVSFDYQANMLGRLVGRAAGVAVVVSSIRSERFGGRHRDLLVRLTDRACSTTVVNSTTSAASLVARGVVPADRLAVITNGIEVEDYRAADGTRDEVRRELGVQDGQFLWLAVGHLRVQKDYPTLLRAVAAARAAGGGEFVVRVVGEGPMQSRLEAEARALGVSDRVQFLGGRSDVPELLHAADALVLSSLHEGMPNAVMEALAVALPVVATDVGGVPELLPPGCGVRVPPEDPDALARALRDVMAMPQQQRQDLGRKGHEHLARHYTTDRAVREWEALLQRAVARAAGRRAVA